VEETQRARITLTEAQETLLIPLYLIPSSVTDLRWIDEVDAGGRPVLVIAEGLLMYLKEGEVRSLLLALRAAFPCCEMACDVYSTMAARRATSMRALKLTGAQIGWGIDDARAIEAWASGIRLKEEWYFAGAPEVDGLNWGYRIAFRLAGRFRTANLAHRILYLAL
jgi:O-methyltransferase involved in polyketide biosynthesis